jgi:hypothetical protein
MKLCDICGETMTRHGTYRALDDDGQRVREFPSDECPKCGYTCPNAERVSQMPPASVPSSVRLRCAKKS